MADDETIVIRVNAAQGEAALKALGSAGIQAGKDIDTVGSTTSGSTDKLAAFGAKLFGLTKIAGTFGEVIRQVGNNVHFESDAAKEATKATADLFTAIGSLDAPGVGAALGKIIGNLEAMREGIDETTLSLGAMANAADAKNFAGILKIQGDLVAGHEAETAALNRKAEALTREIATQTEAGGVQKYVRDAVQETLEAYEKAGEAVPPLLAQQAAQLGIVTRSQQDAAKSAQELEEAGVKSAEERAKAEAKAAEEIAAALERERQALDAKLAQDEARLAKSLGAGGKIDTSGDADAAKQGVKDLRDEIKRLENQPMLDPAEQNKLNELKDQAAQAAASVRDLGKVFTQTANDFLTEGEAADAAAAAWDVYRDRVDKAALAHDDALRSTEDADAALADFTDTADEAASSLGDVADAAGSLGDESKKGAEKGKEGLDKLKDGFTEAIPLAEQLRDVMQEIVTLGSQADI